MKVSKFFKYLLLSVSLVFIAQNIGGAYAASSEVKVQQHKTSKKVNDKRKNTSKNNKNSNSKKSSKNKKNSKPGSSNGRAKNSNTTNYKSSTNESRPSYVSSSSIDLAATNPLYPTTPKLVNQRKYFLDAERAIKSGDHATALRLRNDQLSDYPLSIWIDYWDLALDPSPNKFSRVEDFIRNSNHHELVSLLKKVYVDVMAQAGRYKDVLSLMDNTKPYDEALDLKESEKAYLCRFYEASWHLNKADASASAFADRMFKQLKPYPSGCSGLIYMWGQHGYLNDNTRLSKFEDAFINRNYGTTARSLAANLQTSKYASTVEKAMRYYDKYTDVLEMDTAGQDAHRAAIIVFKRFARLNPREAKSQLESFYSRFKPTSTEKNDIIKELSYAFLNSRISASELDWVDKNLPATELTEDIKLLRMRKAVWYAQWLAVYNLYDELSEYDKREINWRYWKARATIELGQKSEGIRLMSEVAKDRSFFGFLAASELGQDLPFNHERISQTAKWPQTVKNNAAAIRFFEFRNLNNSNANVEWREIAKYSSTDEAMVMAQWALDTGNINYAISFVVASKRWDALDYRFPTAYLDLYRKYSNLTDVPLSFLYGISRQESMLNPVIKSPVGAVGLMQLMPETARLVSRKNSWAYDGTADLVVPENNIRLGSAYLRDMLNRFDNNRILAAAAYNAGPNRINYWKSQDGMKRDTAMFVENIPFKETRLYVQNVLLYDVIYHKLLTGKTSSFLKSHEKKYIY